MSVICATKDQAKPDPQVSQPRQAARGQILDAKRLKLNLLYHAKQKIMTVYSEDVKVSGLAADGLSAKSACHNKHHRKIHLVAT